MRLLDRYFKLLLLISVAAILFMMMTTVVDVFMRYVFNSPVRGAYDIVEICLLVSVYFALPVVIVEAQSITIDLIDDAVSPVVLHGLKAFASLATVGILVFMVWAMVRPAHEAFQFGDVKLELNMPVWIIWAMALLGLVNSVLAAMVCLVRAPEANNHSAPESFE